MSGIRDLVGAIRRREGVEAALVLGRVGLLLVPPSVNLGQLLDEIRGNRAPLAGLA